MENGAFIKFRYERPHLTCEALRPCSIEECIHNIVSKIYILFNVMLLPVVFMEGKKKGGLELSLLSLLRTTSTTLLS